MLLVAAAGTVGDSVRIAVGAAIEG